MQSFEHERSLFDIQPGMPSTQWGVKAHLNNLAVLPMMRTTAFNVVACPHPSTNTPQTLPSRNPEAFYTSQVKAQARIQTQQIESAIQLLKLQYDAIMKSVQKSQTQSLLHPPLQPSASQPTLLLLPSTSSTSNQVIDHRSFSLQFELPGPGSDEQVKEAKVMGTTEKCKRKPDSHPDGNSSANLADSDSCSIRNTSDTNLPSGKRPRRQ